MPGGLGVGIFVVMVMFIVIGWVLFREAWTHRFWRQRVDEGDQEMISQLVQSEVQAWRSERPPKGMSAAVWQGIQNVELLEVGRDYIRVSTSAEPQFALVSGSRRQVSSAIDEAKRITAKLAERLLYDIPHIRPERIQVDVFTTFQEAGGQVAQRCILSALAHRADAADVDWENDAPEEIAERLGARYRLDDRGGPMPIEPDDQAVRVSTNGQGEFEKLP